MNLHEWEDMANAVLQISQLNSLESLNFLVTYTTIEVGRSTGALIRHIRKTFGQIQDRGVLMTVQVRRLS